MSVLDDKTGKPLNGEGSQRHEASMERHFAVRYWSELWGFSEKTVREVVS